MRWCKNNGATNRKRAVALLITGVCASLLLSQAAEKKPEPYSELRFTVVKSDNGKPVRNAAVVLHPIDSMGKQAKGGLELKTDAEGHATSPGMPYGKLRVQVIAPGFQTFGEDYEIKQPQQEFTIRMKPPADQVTIYK